MLRAITHKVSSRIVDCELTFSERKPIDFDLASKQHDAYEDKLAELGVTVMSLSGNDKYPDCSFVEDTAFVLDEVAVICSMGAASRRGEPALIADEIAKYREVSHISLPATIEGGDILRVGRKIIIGLSSRTNRDGVKRFSEIVGRFGYELCPIPVERSLHLKSACCAIDDETLIVNSDWLDPESVRGLKMLRTPAEEPNAANVLRVGDVVCVQEGCPRTSELIYNVTGSVQTIDISELQKAEAGLTCCSIIFES